MKKILLALALLLAPSGAWAQCSGVFNNNTVCGNVTGANASPRMVTISSLPIKLVVGSTAITGGTNLRVLYDNGGILGEYLVSGTGTTALLQTSPTILGHPTVEGVTSTGAAGTGKFVFDTSPTIASPTFTGTTTLSGAGSGSVISTAGVLTSLPGTASTVLHGNASGAPTFTSVNLTSGTDITGILPLLYGGTSASLTASNGGVVYSNASTLAILAGTVTSGQCLLSGSSAAPSWGSCVTTPPAGSVDWPQLAAGVGQLIPAGSTNRFMAGAGNSLATGATANNLGFGRGVFASLTSGTENAVFGCSSTATGASNLVSGGTISTAKNNTIVGCGSGVQLTTQLAGSLGYNTLIGYGVGMWLLSGTVTPVEEVTGVGVNACNGCTTANGSTAIGANSMGGYYYPPGGLGTATTGTFNTAIGYNSLGFVTTGSQNYAGGFDTLLSCSTCSNNVVIGALTLAGDWNPSAGTGTQITGTYNTVLGAGITGITTGNYNTVVGAQTSIPAGSNQVIISDGAGNIRISADSSGFIYFPHYAAAAYLYIGASGEVLSNGGTQWGLSYFPTASSLGSTAAGTTGQALIGTTGAAPSWSATTTLTNRKWSTDSNQSDGAQLVSALAAAGTAILTPAAASGTFIFVFDSAGNFCGYTLNAGLNTTTEIFDPSAVCGNAAGASQNNFYSSGGNYIIQNNTGGARSYHIRYFTLG